MEDSRHAPRLRDALAGAEEVARRRGAASIEPVHFLVAAIADSEIAARLREIGVAPSLLREAAERLLATPIAVGEVRIVPHPGASLRKLLAVAAREASARGDFATTIEHALSALAQMPGCAEGELLRRGGVTRAKLLPTTAATENPPRAPTPILDRHGRDLTRLAAEGRLDPIAGRARELRRLRQILGRRGKSNPLLVGEPGVGKSAIVEALAAEIARSDDRDPLAGKRIVELDLGALVAGARLRGDFEERLQAILGELRRARRAVILFIDEIHLLSATGAGEGALDAAQLLKPALARGEIQVIGATTPDAQRRHLQRDAALERRFSPIAVEEPGEEESFAMVAARRTILEAHHGIAIQREAIAAAIRWSRRYLPSRALPDKALDALDEAASRARIEGESAIGEDRIAEVIAEWSGLPRATLTDGDRAAIVDLEARLSARVIAQAEACTRVASAIRRARAGLADPRRPIGSFLFLGPTGVGKTELARALADQLGGALTRLDMSEYRERHASARMVGAPPGYLGHDEGGQLTEAIRKRPGAVILFDEIEKAHPEVADLLLQIFDDGRLTDGSGRTVTFRDTVIILTSNLRDDAAARARFRPELLGRLDAIVPFQPLDARATRAIAALQLERVRALAADRGIEIVLEESAIDCVARAGCDPRSGARMLHRSIALLVQDPLADRILAGEIVSGDRVAIAAIGDQIRFTIDRREPISAHA